MKRASSTNLVQPTRKKTHLSPFGIPKTSKRKSATQTERKSLYDDLKRQTKVPRWNNASVESLRALNEKLISSKSTIYDFITTRANTKLINKINSLADDQLFYLPITRFNQVINHINATTERYMVGCNLDSAGKPKDEVFSLREFFANHGKRHFYTTGETSGSDPDAEMDLDVNGSIAIQWIRPKAKSHSDVAFFTFLTKIDYNLKDFQVFTTTDQIDETPCFIKTLDMNGVSKDTINKIITTMYKNSATTNFIKSVAEKHNLYFEIQTSKNTKRYGNPQHQLVKAGVVADHIFANFKTKITETALKHPEYVKHPLYPNIRLIDSRGKKYVKEGKTHLSAFAVINYLFQQRNELLIPITIQNAPKLSNNKFSECEELGELNEDEIDYKFGEEERFRDLEMTEEEMKKLQPVQEEVPKKEPTKSKKEPKNPYKTEHVVFADLETLPDNNIHEPYLASWSIDGEVEQHAYGLSCVKKMLYELPNNSLIWFHNLGFDIRFLIQHLSISSREAIIESGNSMKRLKATYYGKNFMFQDTKAFLNNKLSDMPPMFGFEDLDKECYPHDLMTKDNFNKPMLWSYIEANFKDHAILKANALKIDACDEKYLDLKKYAIHYCKKDVEVLKKCFTKFRTLIKDRFKQDVYDYVSLPSLSQAILKDEGCFLGCVSLKGELLSFCRKAIVGGRVMTSENKKHWVKDTKISDFDAVSLYPSAMARLTGFPIGPPIITKEDPTTIPFNGDLIAEYVDDQDQFTKGTYYISRIKVKSLNKKLKFPLQSVMTESHTRDFTNDIVGSEIIADQYAIEDLIKFQDVEVEYIESVVWRHGFNNQITTTIEKLFNERLMLKNQGNPLQECIKLLMNAAYGKLIQKPIIKTKKIVVNYKPKEGEDPKDNIHDYTRQSIKRMISRHDIAKFNDGTVSHALFIEHKPLIQHSSPAHLGVAILSMSKRIMNEVMCVAEDKNMPIYYQDTDSMHIEFDCVEPLAAFYKESYGRELIGKGLGQFHSDFELKDDEGKKIKDTGDIWATESIFLGKKCYVDVLTSENGYNGFHVRMKGIPSKLITTPYETYSKLYNGETCNFELSECCPIMINNKSQVVMKRTSFARKIQFK